jgi:LPXTG-motif cell wall-anchored protein
MAKKILVATVAVLALLVLPMVGAAGAQEGDNPPGCTTDPDSFPASPPCVEVLPEEETPTETPTEVVVVDRTPQVAGVQVQRPLPRTGNDIGPTAILGLALTGAGVALALGARKRRNSFDGV